MGREETLPSPHDPRASQSLLENNIPILPTHHFSTSTYFDCILWDCRKVVGEWREIEVTGGGRVRKKRRVRKETTTSCLPIPSLFFSAHFSLRHPYSLNSQKRLISAVHPLLPLSTSPEGHCYVSSRYSRWWSMALGLLCCLVRVTLIGYLKSQILTRLCKAERTVKKAI